MKTIKTNLLIMFLVATQIFATDYYVAKTGSDSNGGTETKPFKTIQKAESVMVSGDICYIKEGTYNELVTVSEDGLTFQAFDDDFVVVSGADVVTGWTQYSGEIYKAPFKGVEPEFTQLFFEGQRQKMARYPDLINEDRLVITDGYADCDVQAGGEVVFDDVLPGETDEWKGGYFRAIAGLTWMNPMGKITASSGANLTCDIISKTWTENNEKSIGNGVGYIFHLNALSMAGEWYYQNDTLYFWKPGGGQPTDTEVEAQKRELAFILDDRSNINLKNIHIKSASVSMDNTDNSTFEGCSFRYQKGFYTRSQYHWSYEAHGGVYVNGDNNSFNKCYFGGTWGNLLNIEDGSGNSITNSILEDNGYIAQFTSAIQNGSENITIEGNTFGATGRFHIRSDRGSHSNKIDILHNDFSDCMKMGQDAGSIEITNGGNDDVTFDLGGSEIAYNKFHDISTLSSFISEKNFVLALYLEGADNYTAHHNLAYNIRTQYEQGSFLYLGPRQCTITDVKFYNNTVWDVDKMIGVWNKNSNGGIENMEYINNIFYSLAVIDFGTPSLESGVTMNNNLETTNDDIFVNAANGDFTLSEVSTAIDYGEVITGITDGYSGSAPDAGAFEKDVTPWIAGATMNKPIFEDEGAIVTPPDTTINDSNFVDGVSFYNLPSDISQSNTITLDVIYSAEANREVVLTLTSPEGIWLGNKRVQVSKGTDTTSITLTLTDVPPIGDGYFVTCDIREVSSDYTGVFVEDKKTIDITSTTNLAERDVKLMKLHINSGIGYITIDSPLEGTLFLVNSNGTVVKKLEQGENAVPNISSGVYFLQDSNGAKLNQAVKFVK